LVTENGYRTVFLLIFKAFSKAYIGQMKACHF
jgi:hypothetical protein